MYEIFVLLTFITFVVSLVFGVFTFMKNPKNLLNVFWGLTCVATGLWSLGLWGVITSKTENIAYLWQILLDISAIYIPILFLNFSLVLIRNYNEKRKIRYAIWFFSILLVLMSFTSLFKVGVKPIMSFNFWVVPGPFYVVFPIFIMLNVVYSFILLYKRYRKSFGIEKNQLKYVIVSALFGFGGAPTNFFPQLFNIYPFGNFFVVFYVVGVAYAITKHRLMDIRVVLRRYSVYISSLVVIILPSLILKHYVDKFFPKIEQFADYFILLLTIIFFPNIKDYFYRVANRYFFSSLYDDRKIISDISDKLGSTLEIRQIYEYIAKVLKRSFHTRSIAFLNYNDETDEYEIDYRKDMQKQSPKSFVGTKKLYTRFSLSNKPIILSELSKTELKENKQIYDLLKRWGVEVIVPLNLKLKVIGLLVLSRKESGDVYNDTDLRVLELIGAHAAMAIRNAQLYLETLHFNVRLTNEVEKATYELREANEKLKKLDQAKSEFVSIASHQLRTPLTVIKGYISMMLDGSFGRIPKKQQESLKKVFESNERLINLVENLLNISRIESGRLKFAYEDTQLEDMVQSVFEELVPYAKRKNLKFELELPKKKLPIVNIDQEKIRQVIMNLTDNSIKYTNQGFVKANLSLFGDKIKYCVYDSGMGISPEDLPKLFTKFTRGQDTSLVHTEGTGLGLYVAKQMIEAHHGKVWAESDGVGKGSRFCFVLPIKANNSN